jgi:sugar phosphate permease
MGIAYLGIGVGGALVPLVAYALTQRFGWRSALQILGWLMIAVALPAAYFVREPPSSDEDSTGAGASRPPGPGQAPAGFGKSGSASDRSSAAAGRSGPQLKEILSRPAFYLLALGSMASIGAVGGTVQNLALYLSLDRKLPQVDVDGLLSLVLIGSLLGRVTMGWLADRWPKKWVMLLVYSIVAISVPPLFYAPTPAALAVAALMFGVGLGGDYMIIPLMAAELYGVAIMGRVMGVVLTADSVAEAVVPMIVAGVRDRTGSYEGGFFVLVTLALLGAIAVSGLPAGARGASTRLAGAGKEARGQRFERS